MDTIARWMEVAKTADSAGLAELLAENVVFHSPVVHTPQRGKTITHKYLMAASHVLFNDTFAYVGEWRAERSAALEFRTTIEGIETEWRRHHRLGRSRADRRFQGDGAAPEGDPASASHDGRTVGGLDARRRERLSLQPLVQPRH